MVFFKKKKKFIKKIFSYAFCYDTIYNKKIISQINMVNILYYESTSLKKEKKIAKFTSHSTANQAAKIAKVKKLLLGQYELIISFFLKKKLKKFSQIMKLHKY
jgi:ribonuclease BN (tRNA processing enzyme)